MYRENHQKYLRLGEKVQDFLGMKSKMLPFLGVAVSLLSGCAADNTHMPKPEEWPSNVATEGLLVSSIPVFPFWEPVRNTVEVQVDWLNTSATKATIDMDAFSLYVDVVDMHIDIGEMTFENVVFTYNEDHTEAILEQPAFECQAGKYYTTGSLTGTYQPQSGALTLTIDYKPGSMPFVVHSEFSSEI